MTTKTNGRQLHDSEVKQVLASLDDMTRGMLVCESRIVSAVTGKETGTHTLRVRIDGGVVRKVVHTVEHEV